MATPEDYKRLGAWAVMLNPDQGIDRHNRTRTVPMQVLALGYSRTGTLSMHTALQTLGYTTYHFSNIFANVRDADIWQELLAAKFHNKENIPFDYKHAFDQLLGDYSAVTDNPCALFWKELIEAYPDAKIVLVERNEETWLKSIAVLFDGVLHPISTHVLRFTDPYWYGRVISAGRGWILASTGHASAAGAKQNALAVYRKHYADIRAAVPAEKMLEFRLGSGWEPLCKYLGKPVPDVPFPRLNEAATLERTFPAAFGKAAKNSLINLGMVVGVGAVLGNLVWRYML